MEHPLGLELDWNPGQWHKETYICLVNQMPSICTVCNRYFNGHFLQCAEVDLKGEWKN